MISSLNLACLLSLWLNIEKHIFLLCYWFAFCTFPNIDWSLSFLFSSLSLEFHEGYSENALTHLFLGFFLSHHPQRDVEGSALFFRFGFVISIKCFGFIFDSWIYIRLSRRTASVFSRGLVVWVYVISAVAVKASSFQGFSLYAKFLPVYETRLCLVLSLYFWNTISN